MESHGVVGPPGTFSHIYSYQNAETYCIAIQLRPPYETGRGGRHIHKATTEWDSRKGVDDLIPNDMMITFRERSIQVCKRDGSSAWTMIRGLHGATFQRLNHERCFWTMTRHGGRYWLISIELVKKSPGKLWNSLMKDEREANRPEMKWDKDMQKTPMIMDAQAGFVPSTYCAPHARPKYETECDELIRHAGEEPALENGPGAALECRMRDLVDLDFHVEETTQSIGLSMDLDASKWREVQRGFASATDAFGLEIPFGGNSINFFMKCDRESPILQGKLGGCVWRRGCRLHVEQRRGKPVLELRMPKQTPEPWSYIVEGHESLTRTQFDPYQQLILDGLWDDEAIQEKNLGDEHFRQSEYRAAVTCYSRALERNPDSYVALTNRAAARLAFETEMFKVQEILEDALRAVEINPQWHKGKFREGIALCKLHRYDEAIWALEEGKRMDSSKHPHWEDEIRKVKEERIEWANRKKPSYMNDVE
mmetsp:Transcript_45112/g.125085  ORF Transcript_45112/g.125085 Transcript_45112/m.125085 type:complete len:480 (-) Transcript_45112:24-1463(-)